MAVPLIAAAGLLTSLGGGFLRGKAADMARDRLESVANTPGIDTDTETGLALSEIEKYLPRAQGLGSSMNAYNQAELEKLMGISQPGYADRRSKVLGNIDDWLAGKLPEDVVSEIYRNTAAQAVRGGYGTGMQFAKTARTLGLNSLQLQQYGTNAMSSLRSMFPTASLADVSQLSGLTPTQRINLRSAERAQKMSLMAQQAVMPGQTAVWGDTLSQAGGALLGAGIMGGVGGGATGGASTGGATIGAMRSGGGAGGSWGSPDWNLYPSGGY